MSGVFGFPRRTIDEYLAQVGGRQGPDGDAEVRDDRFARVVWGVLTEPGDGVAGALVCALGPAQALRAVAACLGTDGLRTPAVELSAVAGGDRRIGDALARWRPRMQQHRVVSALKAAVHIGARLVTPGDACWPTCLDDLGMHAPLALWCRGAIDPQSALRRSIAVVGSRAADGYGEHVTMEACAGLVDRGFTIVSGAAYGIDGVAHRTALAATGGTVAFLAGGVDRFYPQGHDDLLHRIAAHGLVVAEVPCGSAPSKWRFLARNRLIAAAGAATIVVEAGHRSGALNTAGHAASLARPVGAVPGPVTSPASAGCHRLLREYDAVCVTNAGEMAELVDGPRAADAAPSERTRSALETRVLDALSTGSARTVDDVAARSGLSRDGVVAVLAMLELEGVAAEAAAGWRAVSRRRPAPRLAS